MESYTNARNAPASVVAKSKALTDADYFSKFGKYPEICQMHSARQNVLVQRRYPLPIWRTHFVRWDPRFAPMIVG
jgi:hypothetical protein